MLSDTMRYIYEYLHTSRTFCIVLLVDDYIPLLSAQLSVIFYAGCQLYQMIINTRYVLN